MLGEHESSDALRGQIKKCERESYTAEGRIKVNSPKLLLSERGHLGMHRCWWCLSLGRDVREKREYFVSKQGEGETLQYRLDISRTRALLWSHFVIHFKGKSDTGAMLPQHPEGRQT